MRSITHGEVTFDEMFQLVKAYIQKEPDSKYHITVGTDSQNFDFTQTVMVVAIHKVGNGGIFFYDEIGVRRIGNLKQKLWYETSKSIEIAMKLSEIFEKDAFDYGISIHVDAGHNGPTSQVIPEITAYVRGCGFDCKTKPESYTASAIANKYTKTRNAKCAKSIVAFGY